MTDLTNEQRRFLILLYKDVLSRGPALSFRESNYYADSDVVNQALHLGLSSDDTSDLCWELERKGYIACTPGDDLANNICLTDKTIIFMENRLAEALQKGLSVLELLKLL